MSADAVQMKLESFALISKDPKRFKDGALVLDLEDREECNTLQWK